MSETLPEVSVDRISKHSRLSPRTVSFLSIVAVLILWVLVTEDGFGVVGRLKYPSPSHVITTVVELGPDLLVHSFATFARLISGLIIGVILGITVGLAMMRYSVVFAVLDP